MSTPLKRHVDYCAPLKHDKYGQVIKIKKFGKQTQKKNLGAIAMQYPNVYVAQVALGANPAATINAFKEAKENKGPSIIIAYCPCINHGSDMSNTQAQEKLAVETGYWPIYRYNPTTDKLTIDSKAPSKAYEEFTSTQSRYFSLAKTNAEESAKRGGEVIRMVYPWDKDWSTVIK